MNTVVIDDVAATDADININAQITYSLSGGAGVFTINPMNGHITLVSSLNRESVSNYTLNVTATDMGTPANSASQLVTVIVTDSNDNPPVFSPSSYSVSIPEVRHACWHAMHYHIDVFHRTLTRVSLWSRYLLLTVTWVKILL